MKVSYYEGLNLAIRHAQNIAIKNDVMAEHKNIILFYLDEYKKLLARISDIADIAKAETVAIPDEEEQEKGGQNGQ